MGVLLKANGVKKRFQHDVGQPVEVLNGVDLEIAEGERIAIVGRSGSGKSTLLHILGTLESPTDGTVSFEDEDVFQYDDENLSQFRNRKLGFVFQFHYLMLEFNALENVMMPVLLSGGSRKDAMAKASDLLERVGLKERLNHRPAELSGGEQQRVAIARALVMEPKLVLADEMTGNLDPATGERVLNLVIELQKEKGISLAMVTHDQAVAETFPRVYTLSNGRLDG